MPYEGEFASYGPLRRIANNPRVEALLERCEKLPPEADRGRLLAAADVRPSDWQPTYIVAVDGSNAEVPVRNGYPRAEVSYLTVASVLLHAERLRHLDAERPVDPVAFGSTYEPSAIDCVLPGCNVILQNEADAPASLRRCIYDVLAETRLAPAPHGETLLETYHALLALRPTSRDPRCPYGDCGADRTVAPQSGIFTCACERARPVYATDALRFHEGMDPAGPNGAMYAEIRQVLEHLVLVNALRYLERCHLLATLKQIAFVLDGPLAVFGHPAWLSQAIGAELRRISGIASRHFQTQLLLVGIEKTGLFVDHFTMIDQRPDGQERYAPQTALLIDDGYIKERIQLVKPGSNGAPAGTPPKPYGADTYFGRKFFYKTASGARIVASVPFLRPADADTTTATPQQYPRLADTLSLLDQVVSSRYPNALTPIVLAHQEAAIPLHLGQQVLQQLAQRLMR